MIPYDTLRQAWQAERAHRLARYRRLPVIEDEGLVLGGQSVIARKTFDRWGAPSLAIEGEERRILALLSVAYWWPVGPDAIHSLKRASHALARGNPALAAILVAQSGLQKLDADERVAFRLFAAERLLDAGVGPAVLLNGFGIDAWSLQTLAKYSPDQPRVPAGQAGGGEWSDGEGEAEPAAAMSPATQVARDSQVDRKPATIQEADSGPFATNASQASVENGLKSQDGKPVIDPNTGQPYPVPPGTDIAANVAKGRSIAYLAGIPPEPSLLGAYILTGVPVDARAIFMVDWFSHGGPMDYQRPSGFGGAFFGHYTNVSNYNFGAVAAASDYTLQQTLRAAGMYNRYLGNPKSDDTDDGIQPKAVVNITQGWNDTRAGKWTRH